VVEGKPERRLVRSPKQIATIFEGIQKYENDRKEGDKGIAD
jgi:hypothetical protein